MERAQLIFVGPHDGVITHRTSVMRSATPANETLVEITRRIYLGSKRPAGSGSCE
jgi:hypothetical protein